MDPNPDFKLIMLIDDNDSELYISNRLLNKHGSGKKVITFSMGTDALAYLKNCTSDNDIPDIILCDIHMPLMNGFQFVEEFGKLPDNIRTKSKVFMISSTFNTADIERSNTNPFVVKFYEKPLNMDKINSILSA